MLGHREDLARACHELRGSITAARLGLELGARREQPSPARLRAIELELEKAALAVEDLARAAAPEPGRIFGLPVPRSTVRPRTGAMVTVERVDLPALLADTVEAWRSAAARRGAGLALHWSGAPTAIVGDRLRLAQAVGNLIANAIEHGGGEVEVRARPTDAAVRLEVVDGGPGLPAPVGQLIRGARRGRGRRGRGLAIAAGVAAAHGGRLGVAPSDRGARMVLELPIESASRRRAWTVRVPRV
jgi:signal transduction histidine kinase